MPELDKDDVKNVFLHYATRGGKFENTKDVVPKVVILARWKGESERSHYHPLSLKALGIFLKYHGGKKPSFWIKDLQKVKESSLFAATGESFDHHS